VAADRPMHVKLQAKDGFMLKNGVTVNIINLWNCFREII